MNQNQVEILSTDKYQDLKDIGNKLKKMREHLNITQQELAEKTGVTSAYVYQIEKMPKAIFPSREYLKQFIKLYMPDTNDLQYTRRKNMVNELIKNLGDINYKYYAEKYEKKVTEKYCDLYIK